MDKATSDFIERQDTMEAMGERLNAIEAMGERLSAMEAMGKRLDAVEADVKDIKADVREIKEAIKRLTVMSTKRARDGSEDEGPSKR